MGEQELTLQGSGEIENVDAGIGQKGAAEVGDEGDAESGSDHGEGGGLFVDLVGDPDVEACLVACGSDGAAVVGPWPGNDPVLVCEVGEPHLAGREPAGGDREMSSS